jgi:lipopolysaccharide/colanic/teichoic acid biosynthesis glycosyltransferase
LTPVAPQRLLDRPDVMSPQRRTSEPIIGETLFRDVLLRERKRADRSNQPLALVLVAVQPSVETESARTWRAVLDALSAAKRETDSLGWFSKHQAVGLIVPEVPGTTAAFACDLSQRVQLELSRRLDPRSAAQVSVRLHVHPSADNSEEFSAIDPIVSPTRRGTGYDASKRVLDVVLSALLLVLLAPVFLVLAALVKLTSSGPIFFRQERIGQNMKPFMMLKFRTMSANVDHAIHREFVSAFIQSSGRRSNDESEPGFFKIANDPRVTPIGRLLRRSSLDELPQFWNVLVGEMSLVGPRPPLRYEVEQYKSWHRRRVLDVKPGVTGLWQVSGRSRTTFDEMVRLDLRYAREYSVWMDFRILLATPAAVISGKGAC